jgi:adenosylmethionine-8-amino-7-oxononanoate aminotransferase
VRELCDQYDVLMICDEVATGFGRTGTMFACEQEGVVPDLMTVAKGLTGGYLPLAATLATERIYEGFLGEFEQFRTFFHGHTYTGNPLACAAAIATLDVFAGEDTLAALQPKIALLGELLDEHVAPLASVSEIRRRGTMVGIELTEFPLEARMGHHVTLAARERGAIAWSRSPRGRSRRPRASRRRRAPPWAPDLVLVGDEVALAGAAHGTEPRVGDVVERGPRRDAAVGVTLGGVVDEPA